LRDGWRATGGSRKAEEGYMPLEGPSAGLCLLAT
jgi:hypothetical protein